MGHTCPACPKFDEPIRRIENGAGVRYRVTLDKGNDSQGRRRQETKVLPTLEAAREHVRTRGADLQKERKAGRVVADKLTIDQLCERWLAARDGEVRPNTLESYTHNLKPVRRRLGRLSVTSLTYGDIIAFRKWLAREGGRAGGPLGKHAVRSTLARLKEVLDFAVRVERVIPENVARGVRSPKVRDTGHDLERWTGRELIEFTTYADRDPHAAAWRLSALGMRREEVLGLRWRDVDLGEGTVTVNQTRVAVGRSTDPRGWTIGEPKAEKSHRTIRPDSVQPGTTLALKKLKAASVVNRADNPDGLVVVDEVGRPVVPGTYSDRFTALCEAAGVPTIKLHSTRHTVAYLMHIAGVSPVRAAAFLGHTLAVHLSIYLFASEGDVDLAGEALGALLAEATIGA